MGPCYPGCLCFVKLSANFHRVWSIQLHFCSLMFWLAGFRLVLSNGSVLEMLLGHLMLVMWQSHLLTNVRILVTCLSRAMSWICTEGLILFWSWKCKSTLQGYWNFIKQVILWLHKFVLSKQNVTTTKKSHIFYLMTCKIAKDQTL